MLLLSRSVARKLPASARFTTCRFLSSSSDGPLPVDVDHYTSGWHIKDISEFTQPGKYNVETYNKISPVVSISSGVMLVWGLIMRKALSTFADRYPTKIHSS